MHRRTCSCRSRRTSTRLRAIRSPSVSTASLCRTARPLPCRRSAAAACRSPCVTGTPKRLMPSVESRRRWLVFVALAVVVLIADQVSKLWVDANFEQASVHALPGQPQPTPVIDGFVRIAKSYNTGGIFGLFGDSAVVLALASTAVIALIFVYQWREGTRGSWLLTISLGLLLGGALGNFVDRIRYAHVIDFVDMGIGDWRWYTFNVADSAISIALLGLIVLSLIGDRLNRDRARDGAPQPANS